MKILDGKRFKNLRWLLAEDRPKPAQQAERIVAMQRDVVLPSKAGVLLVVLYYLFYSGWFYEAPTTQSVVMDTLKNFFLVYLLCNLLGAACFIFSRRLPPGLFQWLAFTIGLLDGLFMAGMAMMTGGFDSNVFWVFPGLIVLNALSIPLAVPQIVLNLILSLFYTGAVLTSPHLGWGETAITVVPGRSVPAVRGAVPAVRPAGDMLAKFNKPVWPENTPGDNPPDEAAPEQILLRLAVLWLLTACCYGAQVLLERQRLAMEEAEEFAAREGQLRSAGRLAAEFAHQIKNPLAIINNAAFSLQRGLREGRPQSAEQLLIIQEEVARADKVITQIMGYSQLSEGRVEKLGVVEEINRAIAQVFPAAVPTEINVRREFGREFPPLLMQRGHLSEILVNLLLNARESLGGKGTVVVTARKQRDQAVIISVRDNGPGIPPDKLERIFEAYYTTKEKGSGLGLAIVKHNLELYGGTMGVESSLGQGATFTLTFPAKAVMRFSK